MVGSSGYLIGGTGDGEAPLDKVVTVTVQRKRVAAKKQAQAGGAQPFSGRLMIADRGNDRLLVVNADKKVLWRFPSKAHPAPPGGFYFPDDAFFIHGGKGIISNEEQNERIVQLSYPGGKLLWSFGHPGVTGSKPGYLHEPDDAYLLKSGTVSVADAENCRILLISHAKKVLKEFGGPESCSHEPPHHLGNPNGDTPLANGNILISEVDRLLHRRNHAPGQAHLERAAADRIPLRPPAARPRPLPRRRLHEAGRDLRIQPRREDPLVLQPLLGQPDAQPPEPRRAPPQRADRDQRRLPRPGRDHRPEDEEDRLAVRRHRLTRDRARTTSTSPTASTCSPPNGTTPTHPFTGRPDSPQLGTA